MNTCTFHLHSSKRSFRSSNIYSFAEKKTSANLFSTKPQWIQSERSLDDQKRNDGKAKMNIACKRRRKNAHRHTHSGKNSKFSNLLEVKIKREQKKLTVIKCIELLKKFVFSPWQCRK